MANTAAGLAVSYRSACGKRWLRRGDPKGPKGPLARGLGSKPWRCVELKENGASAHPRCSCVHLRYSPGAAMARTANSVSVSFLAGQGLLGGPSPMSVEVRLCPQPAPAAPELHFLQIRVLRLINFAVYERAGRVISRGHWHARAGVKKNPFSI